MVCFRVLVVVCLSTSAASAPTPAPSMEAPCGCEDGTNFCNYDYGSSGSCEPCAAHAHWRDCYAAGLPDAGAADCALRCFGVDGYSYSYSSLYSYSYSYSYSCGKSCQMENIGEFIEDSFASYSYSYFDLDFSYGGMTIDLDDDWANDDDGCTDNCYGYSCDTWLGPDTADMFYYAYYYDDNSEFTCGMLETSWGCDCSGCTCSGDDGDGEDDDCAPQYHNLYCDDGSLMYGQNCGDDDSCSSCESVMDYTAMTDGKYSCDDTYFYYDEDLDGSPEEQSHIFGCYYDGCGEDNDGGDDNCEQGYQDMYCDGSSLMMKRGCGDDDTCSSCEPVMDYTAMTDGKYSCDDTFFYYDEDLDGSPDQTTYLPGCHYDDCDDNEDDCNGLPGYEKLYCNGSNLMRGSNCGDDDTCSSCESVMDYTALSGGMYSCDVTDFPDLDVFYVDEDLDGSPEQIGILNGCSYNDDCGHSYSYSYSYSDSDSGGIEWPTCVDDCEVQCLQDGDETCISDCSASEASFACYKCQLFGFSMVGVTACQTPEPTGSPTPMPGPTGSPTPMPTPEPTPKPTTAGATAPTPKPTASAYTEVSWTSSVSMVGIAASEITENDKDDIIEAMAAASDDLEPSNIEIVSITDSSASRRKRHILRRKLVSEGVVIDFEITLNLEASTYTDAEDLFDTLTNEVEVHVTTGVFEADLVEINDSAFGDVTVDEDSYTSPTTYVEERVTMAPSPEPTSTEDSNNTKEGGIDMVVVAGGIGAVVIISLCACFMMNLQKKKVAPG